jgi:hypothetical protein
LNKAAYYDGATVFPLTVAPFYDDLPGNLKKRLSRKGSNRANPAVQLKGHLQPRVKLLLQN